MRPRALVCLGATAARAIPGRSFRLTEAHGQWRPTRWAIPALATWHPAALLRMPDPGRRHQALAVFTEELRRAASATPPPSARDRARL